MSRIPRVAAAIALALVAITIASCTAADSGWPPENINFELTPVPVSADVAVGTNRMLFNILDRQNRSIASPDRVVQLRFFDFSASRTQPAVDTQATFIPTVEGRPGLYRAIVELGTAGEWGVEAVATDANGTRRTGRMVFPVREAGTTPALGGPAPATENPVAGSVADIANISTDDDPDPDFYRATVGETIAAHKPFAVIFATPAFCTSATCGPTLDLVKSVAAEFKGRMEFIHVEPYELELVEGHLRPLLSPQNLPIPVESATQWGLPTEPYIFVVDAAGNVKAKFEGIASTDELREAFSAVASAV